MAVKLIFCVQYPETDLTHLGTYLVWELTESATMSSKRIAAPGTSGEADSVCRRRPLMQVKADAPHFAVGSLGESPARRKGHLYPYKTLSLVEYWLRYDIPKVNNFFSDQPVGSFAMCIFLVCTNHIELQ